MNHPNFVQYFRRKFVSSCLQSPACFITWITPWGTLGAWRPSTGIECRFSYSEAWTQNQKTERPDPRRLAFFFISSVRATSARSDLLSHKQLLSYFDPCMGTLPRSLWFFWAYKYDPHKTTFFSSLLLLLSSTATENNCIDKLVPVHMGNLQVFITIPMSSSWLLWMEAERS